MLRENNLSEIEDVEEARSNLAVYSTAQVDSMLARAKEENTESYAEKKHTHKVSDIVDFPESMPASDVRSRAKTENKPNYNWEEIQGKPELFPAQIHHHNKSEV